MGHITDYTKNKSNREEKYNSLWDTKSVVMFFGTQNIQFLTYECKICSKQTKENTNEPFDLSCKYQYVC